MSDLISTHNRVVWCDIFVDDLDRACAFYEGVCDITCTREAFGDIKFAVLVPRTPD
jgi:predicted enzyme related to lactoylglutathione lyase